MGRRLAVLTAAGLAVAVLAGTAGGGADAASRFKTVTKTFSSNAPITIPDSGAATPYPSERNVSGFQKGKVLDVEVTLKNFSHTHPHDVDVMLEHRGRNTLLMSDAGGAPDVVNITLGFDDEASAALDENAALSAGTFRPTNNGSTPDPFPAPAPVPNPVTALSNFDGQNPNGAWRLYVVDDVVADQGQIAGGWSVKIKARVPR